MNEAYIKACEFIRFIAGKSLIELTDKKWVGNIDKNWIIAIHANKDKEIEFKPEGTMGGKAKFGIMLVWFNGWLAGMLDPYSGIIAAGKFANENTFIEAIELRLIKKGVNYDNKRFVT